LSLAAFQKPLIRPGILSRTASIALHFFGTGLALAAKTAIFVFDAEGI